MGLGEPIFRVQVNRNSLKDLERTLGKRLASRVEDRMVKVTNKLAQEAAYALKSKAPIDTGELRNDFIAINYAKKGKEIAEVGIESGIHHGRDGKPILATLLARILQQGGPSGSFKRSMDSIAESNYSSIGRGEPTKEWITRAKLAFATRRRSLGG